MNSEQKIELIKKEELNNRALDLKSSGYRLVQMSATTLPENYEITYCFEKDYKMDILRIMLDMDDKDIPTLSEIFFSACLYENEIHDLFGINFPGIALDFKGNFYQTAVKTPYSIIKKEKTGDE